MVVVALLVDVIPLHAAKWHELGDVLFMESKGRCSHEVGAISRAWRRHVMCLVVKIGATWLAMVAASWFPKKKASAS